MLETFENEELMEKVMDDLNSGKQSYDFVRIENHWEEGKDVYFKIVVRLDQSGLYFKEVPVPMYFVEVILRENNEIEVGDLEDYDLENDRWD